jgi:hypothetical protein
MDLQLDLSSSGGHEECDDGVATMLWWLEGVGIWSAPSAGQARKREYEFNDTGREGKAKRVERLDAHCRRCAIHIRRL